MRTAVALALLSLGMLIGCASAPRPTSSPTPTSTPTLAVTLAPTSTLPPPTSPSVIPLAFKTVTSPLFGWSIEIPETWRLRAATTQWPPHTYPEAGAAYTDNMEPETGAFPALDVSVQQLPDDQTPGQFIAFITAENEVRGYEVISDETIVVDGAAGRIQLQKIGTEAIWEVLVVDGDTAYAIYWVDLESQLAESEALFRQMMDTFRFPDD